MARGFMYELRTDPTSIGSLDETDLYGDLGAIGTDYVRNITGREADEARNMLLERMREYGAPTGTTPEGIPYFTATEGLKQRMFAGRVRIFRDKAAGITPEEFSADSNAVYALRMLLCDTGGDCVYDDMGCWTEFDSFVRGMDEGETYYVGNVVLLH